MKVSGQFYACWESLYKGAIPYIGIHMYILILCSGGSIHVSGCASLAGVDPVNRQDHCPSSSCKLAIAMVDPPQLFTHLRGIPESDDVGKQTQLYYWVPYLLDRMRRRLVPVVLVGAGGVRDVRGGVAS